MLVIQLYIVTFVAHWAQCSLFSSHTHFHNQHTAQKKRVSMPRSRGAASVELSTRLWEIYNTWRRLLSNRTFSSFKVPSCGFTDKNLWRHHAICHLGNGQLSICMICLTWNWDACPQRSQLMGNLVMIFVDKRPNSKGLLRALWNFSKSRWQLCTSQQAAKNRNFCWRQSPAQR